MSGVQVVLWTSALLGTLLAGSGVADGQQYIFRETVRLFLAAYLVFPDKRWCGSAHGCNDYDHVQRCQACLSRQPVCSQ